MKQKLTILTLLILTVISACRAAPEPTLSADDIANTALANAWLAITQTQAAIPTATIALSYPPTPTFTPLPPTPTLLILPTLAPTIAVAVTPTPECNQIPSLKPKGQLVNVEFKNESDGIANPFSFGMNYPNDFGECVTYGFSLGRFDTTPVTVLAGCYWGYAYITGEGNQTSTAQGVEQMCLTDPTFIYQISIGKETIVITN